MVVATCVGQGDGGGYGSTDVVGIWPDGYNSGSSLLQIFDIVGRYERVAVSSASRRLREHSWQTDIDKNKLPDRPTLQFEPKPKI